MSMQEPRAQDRLTQQQRGFEEQPTQASEPLQTDPMLEMSAPIIRRADFRSSFTTVAVIAVLSVLFYGLNHQRDEG